MAALEFTYASVVLVWSRESGVFEVLNLRDDPEDSSDEEYGTLGSVLRGLGVTLEDCRRALEG